MNDETDRTAAVAGQEIDSYQIIRELGRGGMGAVYLAARADESFDKQVALKLINCTPARFVVQLRVEAARRQLEDTDLSTEQIARNCGFASADLMRRAFIRSVGTTPGRYRGRLSATNSEQS